MLQSLLTFQQNTIALYSNSIARHI